MLEVISVPSNTLGEPEPWGRCVIELTVTLDVERQRTERNITKNSSFSGSPAERRSRLDCCDEKIRRELSEMEISPNFEGGTVDNLD